MRWDRRSEPQQPVPAADDTDGAYPDPVTQTNDIRIFRELLIASGYSKGEVGRLKLDSLSQRHLEFLINAFPRDKH